MSRPINEKKYRGYLGNLRKRKISGWAFEIGNRNPVTIDILINGKLVGQSLADRNRPNLKNKKVHPTGKCGFEFTLPFIIDESEIVEIRALVSKTNFELSQSPVFNEKDTFFFLHIPKTGGSTFRELIYKNFKPFEIFPNLYELVNVFGGNYAPMKEVVLQKNKWFTSQRSIYMGHYPIGFINHFQIKPKVIVFFREPIKRTISNILHFHRRHPKFKGKPIAEIIKPNGAYNKALLNVQAKLLGYRPARDNFEECLQNLNQCDFIGLTENIEVDIRQCVEQFGWETAQFKTKNESSKREYEAIKEEIGTYSEDLKSLNTLDLQLYERVCKMNSKYK